MISHLPGGEELPEVGDTGDVGGRKRQANRDKRLAQKRRIQDREELKNLRQAANQGPGGGGKGKSKGKGGKSKDQSGAAICFSWASGAGPCGKLPPGAECACQV